jgi:signal transduction histidine kinase
MDVKDSDTKIKRKWFSLVLSRIIASYPRNIDQGNDITERLKAEREVSNHGATARRFSILSRATAELNECTDIESIIQIVCDKLTLLLENSRVFGFDFPETGFARIIGAPWLDPLADQISELTGIDIAKPAFELNNDLNNLFNIFKGNRVTQLDGGLNDLLSGRHKTDAFTELQNLLDAHCVYTIGIFQKNIFYGGFVIISNNPMAPDDISIIEAISNQTALNIHRRMIEKHLRKSEDRFRNLNRKLELKVKERTADLESLNEKLNNELEIRVQAEKALMKSEQQLKELNATKDKFFNIVAHDLKNPFTSLLGSSELLFDNIDSLGKNEISQLATILNDSAKSGYAILQNLLDWSRSQTGLLKINPEVFSLKKQVEEIMCNMELFCSNKKITIISEIGEAIAVYADKNMTNTVLRNLISNALKFSYRKGKIIIGANTIEGYVEIYVRDFGTGISVEEIDMLFRIDSKFSAPGTEKEQGTGLGLKLCREFVEKQGGRIWVESEVNKGSCFHFTVSIPKG